MTRKIALIAGLFVFIFMPMQAARKLTKISFDKLTYDFGTIYEKDGNEIIVRVGEVEHPMVEEHYIMWIAQVSDNQTTRIRLEPNQKPEVRFKYIPNSTIYAYCNKHGLWKTEVE